MKASAIEISQFWGSSLIRVDRFSATRRLTAGPAGDFRVPLDGRTVLVEAGAVHVPGGNPVAIGPATDVRVHLGTQTFRVRAVPVDRRIPLDFLGHVDWFFIGIWVALFALLVLEVVILAICVLLVQLWQWLVALLASAGLSLPFALPAVAVVPSPSPSIVSVTIAPPAEGPFFTVATPRPIMTPIPMGDILTARPRKMPRPELVDEVRMAGVLQLLKGSDVEMADVFGGVEGGIEGGVVGGVIGGVVGSSEYDTLSKYENSSGLVGTGSGLGGLGGGGGGTALGIGSLGTRSGGGLGTGTLSKRSRSGVLVDEDGAEVLGSLSAEEISSVVKRHMAAIRYCYERELLANPESEATEKIVLSFAVDGDGSTSNVQARSGSDVVGTCLEKQIARMKFPAHDGPPVRVTYPFIFTHAAD